MKNKVGFASLFLFLIIGIFLVSATNFQIIGYGRVPPNFDIMLVKAYNINASENLDVVGFYVAGNNTGKEEAELKGFFTLTVEKTGCMIQLNESKAAKPSETIFLKFLLPQAEIAHLCGKEGGITSVKMLLRLRDPITGGEESFQEAVDLGKIAERVSDIKDFGTAINNLGTAINNLNITVWQATIVELGILIAVMLACWVVSRKNGEG